MKLNPIVKILGSGFYTGYIPFASGTFGSIAATAVYFIPGFSDLKIIIPVVIISYFVGIYTGDRFETVYGKDPAEFTWDEFAGTWISYLFLPVDILWIGAAFVLWRALDIIKPFPAGKLESVPGGKGIMLDDIVSGIYTCLAMNLVYRIFFN